MIELERLLGEEVAKTLDLELELKSTKSQLQQAERKASEATTTARQARSDFIKELEDTQMKADVAYHQLKVGNILLRSFEYF